MNFLPGRFLAWGIFYGEDSFEGRNFRGKLYTGGICQSFYLKLFYFSYFLFADSVLRLEMLRVIVRGKFFIWIELLVYLSVGRENFSSEVEPDLPKLFKKLSDIKLKKHIFFSTESKEQH